MVGHLEVISIALAAHHISQATAEGMRAHVAERKEAIADKKERPGDCGERRGFAPGSQAVCKW